MTSTCRVCRRTWGELDPAVTCPWCGGALEPAVDEAPPDVAGALPVRVDARRAAQLVRDWVGQTPSAGPELAAVADGLRFVWLPVWRVDTVARGTLEVTVSVDEEVPGSFVEVWVAGAWARRGAASARSRSLRRVARVDRPVEGLAVAASARPPFPVHDVSPAVSPPEQEGPVLWPSRGVRARRPDVDRAVRAHLGALALRAAEATRLDEVVWRPDADPLAGTSGDTWSLRLAPAWVGWYRDEDRVVRTLVVDGTTGECHGPRLGSRAVAAAFAGRQTAMAIAGALFGAFLTLVGVVVWLLLPVAALVGMIVLATVLSARSAGPEVHRWNRRVLEPDRSVDTLSHGLRSP